MTRQRQVILEELRKVDCHPTADELYLMVRSRLPRVSLGTVYRNLDVLFRNGEIQKLDAGGQHRFDGDVRNHYHVRCQGCGRIDDVFGEALEALAMPRSSAHDYEITGYRLEFDGLCPACVPQAEGGE
jgi:Fur family ferric uptake transcriptional regulator